jgi:hypothetical protein
MLNRKDYRAYWVNFGKVHPCDRCDCRGINSCMVSKQEEFDCFTQTGWKTIVFKLIKKA